MENVRNKIKERFDHDPTNYRKTIKTFAKKTSKLTLTNDSLIQKSLFTFLQEFSGNISKGRKRKGLRIPVQSTARSRRQIKHRGSGQSLLGRPLKERSTKVQLQVLENEEFVAYSLPSRKTKQKKTTQFVCFCCF